MNGGTHEPSPRNIPFISFFAHRAVNPSPIRRGLGLGVVSAKVMGCARVPSPLATFFLFSFLFPFRSANFGQRHRQSKRHGIVSGEEARNDFCFACGKANSIGLKMTFCERGGRYLSVFTPGPEHQSYDGALHGGIIGTVLDEVMGRVHCKRGLKVVTTRMETRFRHPTPVGQALTVSGWVIRERGKLIETAGSVALPDGTVTAEAKATLLVVATSTPRPFRMTHPAKAAN